MRFIPTAAAVAALAACAAPPADGQEAEAQAVVAGLERQVMLPDDHRPLSGYDRYYSVSDSRIEAVYFASADGSGRIHLVDRLPEAKAEGCSVVNLVFDRASNRFDRILCNEVRLTKAEPRPRPAAASGMKVERG